MKDIPTGVRDQTFTGVEITLDGHTFTRCTFVNCCLIVLGQWPFHLIECTAKNVEIRLVGDAASNPKYRQAFSSLKGMPAFKPQSQ